VPLDPTAEVMLQALHDMGLDFTIETPIAKRRAAMTAAATNPNVPKHPVHAVEDHNIPTTYARIPVRVYRPSDEPDLPLLLWFHGGGWTSGNLETHDSTCRLLCDDVGCIVMSVDYRLAPEEKFPGPVNDCLGAYDWATRHAAEIGGDASRVAIGGDSAGGNLTAVVALLANERGLPAPKLQLLVVPVTDYEFESPSMIDNAKGYHLETETMRWFFDQYARTPADFDDRRLVPMKAESLRGLAPAVVITAECDPLRDQGEAYARRLQQEGVPTQMLRADGMTHVLFGLHAFMPPAQEAWDVSVAALREALGIAG
jgi:acetyl esterase